MPVKKTTSTETAKAAEKKPAAKKTVTKAASKTASENKTTVKKAAAAKPKAVKEAEKAAEKATEKKTAAKKSTAAKPKAVKETTKTAAKKTAAKKTTAKAAPKAEKTVNEVAVKPAAEIVAVAVEETAPVKKTSKKVNREVVTDEVIITPVKEAKAEEKEAVKPAAKKAPAKKAPARKATVKKPVVQGSAAAAAAAKATEAVMARAAEAARAAREAAEAKAAAETAAKEAKKARPFMELTDEKLNAYKAFDNGTLLEMANALGLGKDMESLKNAIQSALDLEKLTLDLEAGLNREHDYVFEEDGFDETVLPVLVENIANTLPHKASDAADLIGEIDAVKEAQLTDDGMKNADLYNRLFDLVKQVLMTAQNNNMHTLAEVETIIPTDLRPLVEHFMDVAYDLLPYWQYNDVKFYEGFIYALISQFMDLKDLDNRAMMDVADLYIKHGDYGRGDADYNYIIRENNLKDYIYFRFANVYRPIDFQKAKAIASSSLQYVDGRYDYYPAIMEILNS